MRQEYRRALELFDNGRYEEAARILLGICRSARAGSALFQEAHLSLGTCYYRQGDFLAAARAVEKIGFGRYAEAFFGCDIVVASLYKAGYADEAELWIKQILGEGPRKIGWIHRQASLSGVHYEVLAQIRRDEGNTEEADAILRNAARRFLPEWYSE